MDILIHFKLANDDLLNQISPAIQQKIQTMRARQIIEFLTLLQELFEKSPKLFDKILKESKELIKPEMDTLTIDELNCLLDIYESDVQFTEFIISQILDMISSFEGPFSSEFINKATLKLFQNTHDMQQKNYLGDIFLHQECFLNQDEDFYLELFQNDRVLPDSIKQVVQNKISFFVQNLNKDRFINSIMKKV